MASRTLHLIIYRQAANQRAHFAIFVPSAADPESGTKIHVVGAPMVGYRLEFKRHYFPTRTNQHHEMISIGQIDSSNIVDDTTYISRTDETPTDKLEEAAAQIKPPGI
ncbi:hypothetical protein Golomagni_08025, partial [Golovinomyces magnicellulatus]